MRRVAIRVRSRSKYHAVPTVVDGHRFASKAEAQRYGELRLLEKAGKIWGLELQPRFPLAVLSQTGLFVRITIGEYRADFKYRDGTTAPYVVEDVKGVATPLYKWKKKHVEAQYGVTIQEIRAR